MTPGACAVLVPIINLKVHTHLKVHRYMLVWKPSLFIKGVHDNYVHVYTARTPNKA